ncbi:flagellar export chaperone FliS [Butyrivibrio fibrisolvens]|uniref:flagellar export chaperone FliS n=1 Tax=Butyrivibrio fibrisolvens TaxID=831 RepID=UPI0003B47942|nr:flagellar export chaperone FliS [Butyrivibrio fibrisolvens]
MAQLTAQQRAAFAQYKNNKVLSASGPELTLMLYDGAIRFLNIADVAIEKSDIQKAHDNIIKTEKIIEYLWNTLDMQYEVAKDFENMYSYISRRLIEANMTKDREIIAEVNKHMHAIRDNWIQVMKANNIVVKEA